MMTTPGSLTATSPHSAGGVRRASVDRLAGAASAVMLAAALFMGAIIAGLALYGYSHGNRIYEGVTVAGVPVGGLTEAEARAALEQRFQRYLGSTLTLQSGDKAFVIAARDAGILLDAEASVREAFAFGRSGSWWDRTRLWARAIIRGQRLPAHVIVEPGRLNAYLTGIAPDVTQPPTDAHIRMDGESGPAIQPEAQGVALDVGTTRSHIVERFRWFDLSPVDLATVPVAASVTVADLQETLAQAQEAVAAPLVISALDRHWSISPDDLKRIIAVPSGDLALRVNRESLRPLVEEIAAQVERPSRDASVTVNARGAFIVVTGRNSVAVDRQKSVDAIAEAVVSGRHQVALVVQEEPPAITDADAAEAVARAEELIANGLLLRWKDGEDRLTRDELLNVLVIRPQPGEPEPFQFDIDRERLTELLQPIADRIAVPAQDAQYRLSGDKIMVQREGRPGQVLNVGASVEAIAMALLGGKTSAVLTVDPVEPTFSAATIRRIKLDDVLAEASTYYGDSSEARRHNIERAAELETGWLIPPGGQFSYVDFIGEVTPENGFVTGFGIVASPAGDGSVTTAPVIGGGICQVSTTIFQAAFWAGLRIDERHEHPYWMATYGSPPLGMQGLDAMVNVEDGWTLDLRFTNTTGNWIAVVVEADGQYVTAKIVGTDPGWDVEVGQPVITDVVAPSNRTYYTESPELPQGQELQVEYAQEGFTATIRRIVRNQDGQTIDETVLTSTYAASRNTILRGTGASAGDER